MKLIKLFLFACCCFIYSNLFAQTPKAIEADLLKSFKKIDYWFEQRKQYDSLQIVNDQFQQKLKEYSNAYPITISLSLKDCKNAGLGITTSKDGLLRIYSWDTQMGGTMHIYNDLLQYKVYNKTYSTNLRDTSNEADNGNSYDDIYTLKANGKIYYLVKYSSVYDSHNWGVGIKIFSIENDKLTEKAEIIKTEGGLSNEIGWYCNENNIGSQDINFHYDELAKKIYLPTISGNGDKYNDYTIYKFTGQYFERVKN